MANIKKLIVFNEARELIRQVRPITEGARFGDLGNQIRRSCMRLARASASEAQGQL